MSQANLVYKLSSTLVESSQVPAQIVWYLNADGYPQVTGTGVTVVSTGANAQVKVTKNQDGSPVSLVIQVQDSQGRVLLPVGIVLHQEKGNGQGNNTFSSITVDAEAMTLTLVDTNSDKSTYDFDLLFEDGTFYGMLDPKITNN